MHCFHCSLLATTREYFSVFHVYYMMLYNYVVGIGTIQYRCLLKKMMKSISVMPFQYTYKYYIKLKYD